jgi:hypothetical protein
MQQRIHNFVATYLVHDNEETEKFTLTNRMQQEIHNSGATNVVASTLVQQLI